MVLKANFVYRFICFKKDSNRKMEVMKGCGKGYGRILLDKIIKGKKIVVVQTSPKRKRIN